MDNKVKTFLTSALLVLDTYLTLHALFLLLGH